MRRAIYRAPSNFLWRLFGAERPPPVEVEFVEWVPDAGMARVRIVPAPTSLLGIVAKHQGRQDPLPPVERVVPAECLTLLDAS